MLPFDIWLDSAVILFYPTLSRWCNSLNKKGPKRITRKKTATDRRRSRFVLFFFISWVQQLFNRWGNFPWIQLKWWLNPPVKVSKNTLIVFWYMRVLIWHFKAFNMVLVTFISLIRFLLYSLISSSFLVLLRYSFLIFNFISVFFYSVCFHYYQVLVGFLFSGRFYFSLDLIVLFLPSFDVFRFSLLAWHIFLYQIPSLYPDCILSLPD